MKRIDIAIATVKKNRLHLLALFDGTKSTILEHQLGLQRRPTVIAPSSRGFGCHFVVQSLQWIGSFAIDDVLQKFPPISAQQPKKESIIHEAVICSALSHERNGQLLAEFISLGEIETLQQQVACLVVRRFPLQMISQHRNRLGYVSLFVREPTQFFLQGIPGGGG